MKSKPQGVKREKVKWLRLETDGGWQIILPETDSKPHGFPKGGEVELAWMDCPCKPKLNYLDKMIIHNSFEDMAQIDEAIKQI